MRIISGKWKGRRLSAPTNLPTRPTTDFAKEALFNILNHRIYLDEIKVLDLFAGIGSMSLEFASRGAQKIVSVEENSKCVQFIEETKIKLEADNIDVLKKDVFQYLANEKLEKFDVIFADPPFDLPKDDYFKIIQLVFENDFLEDDGIFVLEHSQFIQFEQHENFQEHKKYGNVHFSFFE